MGILELYIKAQIIELLISPDKQTFAIRARPSHKTDELNKTLI